MCLPSVHLHCIILLHRLAPFHRILARIRIRTRLFICLAAHNRHRLDLDHLQLTINNQPHSLLFMPHSPFSYLFLLPYMGWEWLTCVTSYLFDTSVSAFSLKSTTRMNNADVDADDDLTPSTKRKLGYSTPVEIGNSKKHKKGHIEMRVLLPQSVHSLFQKHSSSSTASLSSSPSSSPTNRATASASASAFSTNTNNTTTNANVTATAGSSLFATLRIPHFPTCTQCLKCNRYIHKSYQNPNFSGKYNPSVMYPRNRELVCLDNKVEYYSVFECKICRTEYAPYSMPAQCIEPSLCLANPPCACVQSYLVQCFTQTNTDMSATANEPSVSFSSQWRHKGSNDSSGRSAGSSVIIYGTGALHASTRSSTRSRSSARSSARRVSFIGSFSSRKNEYMVHPIREHDVSSASASASVTASVAAPSPSQPTITAGDTKQT